MCTGGWREALPTAGQRSKGSWGARPAALAGPAPRASPLSQPPNNRGPPRLGAHLSGSAPAGSSACCSSHSRAGSKRLRLRRAGRREQRKRDAVLVWRLSNAQGVQQHAGRRHATGRAGVPHQPHQRRCRPAAKQSPAGASAQAPTAQASTGEHTSASPHEQRVAAQRLGEAHFHQLSQQAGIRLGRLGPKRRQLHGGQEAGSVAASGASQRAACRHDTGHRAASGMRRALHGQHPRPQAPAPCAAHPARAVGALPTCGGSSSPSSSSLAPSPSSSSSSSSSPV